MKFKFSFSGLNCASKSKQFETLDLDFKSVYSLTKSCNYSPIIWSDGKRLASNFIAANSLVLDFDDTWPMEAAKAEFQSTENVAIVTSKSHQSEFKIDDFGRQGKPMAPGDYYHVIIGLPEPITDLPTYKTVMTNLIAKYGSDPSCKDGGRFYFGNPRQEHWYS